MKSNFMIGGLLALCLAACNKEQHTAITPTPVMTALASTASAVEPSVTVQPRTTVAAADGLSTDARAAIGAAVNLMNSNGPYRMHVVPAQGTPADVFVVPPDRSRFVQKQEDGSMIEIITIGDTDYVFMNGAWTITKNDPNKPTELAWTAPSDLNALQNIKTLGVQDINGVQATGYSFTESSSPGETNTLWIGSNGAPVRIVVVSAEDKVTFDVAYDPSFTVEPPSK